MVAFFKICDPSAKCVIGPHASAVSGSTTSTRTKGQTNSTMQHATVDGGAKQAELLALLRSLRAWVEHQLASGVRWYPSLSARRAAGGRPSSSTAGGDRAAGRARECEPERRVPGAAQGSPPVRAVAPVAGELFADRGVQQAESLQALRTYIGDCRRCKLCAARTNVVFGVGNPKAELMFVGEGPGQEEDLQAEPFVGRAGQLLTDIITKGMKLRREDVYIANIVKCRPPNNRAPEADEVAACLPFLMRQIELLRPRVIVALGSVAVQALLGTRVPITRLRGVWHEYRGVKVMPTFHPAYLLRNPAEKKLVWADIKQVMQELGRPL